jgi:hypothetical protein
MNEIIANLLGQGYTVEFAASGDPARPVNCYVVAATGDAIVGSGAAPDEALRSAAGTDPLASEDAVPVIPWKHDGGATWTAVRADGARLRVERLDDGESFLPSVTFGAGFPPATGPVCAGLMAAAAWCAEFGA